ncbi:MAG: Wzz/FepE/Etk N-terminal domain-containing protein [Betaproteobacteria bacterium]
MTENTNSNTVENTAPQQDDDEINLFDLLIVLAKHKLMVLGFPLVAGVLAVIYSLMLPNIYTATTKILPPQQAQSGAASMLAQLGGLAGAAGGIAGIKNPSDLYIGMMKSRTVADNIIQRFELLKIPGETATKLPSGARAELAGVTVIAAGKDGIINIDVDDKDPKRAADLANAYVEELMKLTQVLAVTEASQRRLFFERQLGQAKESLAKAEAAARGAMQSGGLILVEGQGRNLVETTARLRGQITVKEVQIGAMRSFATDRNPDMRMAQQELDTLRYELARLEGAGTSGHSKTSADRSPDKAGSGIDSVRLLRDVKYQETVYELLAKQFELAKIDEAKESTVVQVLDKAIEPARKSKPTRSRIVMVAVIAALLIGVIGAFLVEALFRAKAAPGQAERLGEFRRAIAWRN